MANRDAEPVFSGRRVDSNIQIQALLDLVAELKEDLNNLRTDFRAHDHGTTYTATAIRLGAAAGTFSGTAEAGTAVVKPVPISFLNA